jgi:hypothetical protein
MSNYTFLDAIKDLDFGYIRFLIEEWWFKNVDWRFRHYILQQRCENCRSWHFCGKSNGRLIGTCDLQSIYWEDYHGYCPVWGVDLNEDESHEREDRVEREWKTPCGKVITQISRGGIYQYLYDGKPKWMEEVCQ